MHSFDLDKLEDEAGSFEAYFRTPELAAQAPLAWLVERKKPLLDALRSLFSGPQHVVQLRLWCLLALASVPKGRLDRDDLAQLFHALQPQALENVLKRLRDADLLVWDAIQQDYALSDLARQVHSLLAPLTIAEADESELAQLLTQVAGAQALGLVDASQLQHLHAQLARLHSDFAEAIASGSEARLREAQPRFERALQLVDSAGQALTALIRSDSDDPWMEREARALGHAQARLLSMASQFNRAMQQADRQRVTLGSTGVNSSDVRDWLRDHAQLHSLLDGALSGSVQPWLISQQELLDVAEAELERDRPNPERSHALPPPHAATGGLLDVPSMPEELHGLIDTLARWKKHDLADTAAGEGRDAVLRPVHEAVLGGRFAQAAYRMQLLPLLGDPQAQTLKGQTGELARAGWRAVLLPCMQEVDSREVLRMSQGRIVPADFQGDAALIEAARAALDQALPAAKAKVKAIGSKRARQSASTLQKPPTTQATSTEAAEHKKPAPHREPSKGAPT
ncbi:hypothetical protein [Lampropedia aestuarii]|uniref:hypothetical protein n=1 Tax=Lampropedia aestuarii TaxID=2562762 RepID=UPI00246885B4|nr:hypothetical protein [Lampropedia aestuarii]MDH5857003.1 hypothetical protein [Lampropedia aestuarii]